MSDYTQGVFEDGAAILKDGLPMTIEQILTELRGAQDGVEPVGFLGVEHFKNDPKMQNVEYEHNSGTLKPGVYKLYTRPPNAVVPEWIKCSERLPTEDDADMNGNVWCALWDGKSHTSTMFGVKTVAFFFNRDKTITHWMPTGLNYPSIPKQEQES